jgi:hypothetical protein
MKLSFAAIPRSETEFRNPAVPKRSLGTRKTGTAVGIEKYSMSPILQNHYVLAIHDTRPSAAFYVSMVGFHVGRPMARTAGNPR